MFVAWTQDSRSAWSDQHGKESRCEKDKEIASIQSTIVILQHGYPLNVGYTFWSIHIELETAFNKSSSDGTTSGEEQGHTTRQND
jgi:hypothetical protein